MEDRGPMRTQDQRQSTIPDSLRTDSRGSRNDNRPPMRLLSVLAALAMTSPPPIATAQAAAPPAASQNPSPMVEETRAHGRLAQRDVGGVKRSFAGPTGKPVELFVPPGARARDSIDLVVHFHGASWLAQQAVAALENGTTAAVVNLGAGSGTYHRAFENPTVFDSLMTGLVKETSSAIGKRAHVDRLTLVGFSAGHGAIRAILREPRHFEAVDAVLLLDGMHTSYLPEGTVIAAGGTLDTTNLAAFARFARAAVRGEKRFVVTHSEIFPGTFASTTETADWLLRAINLRRKPVLTWGPRGMQQLSEVRSGGFELLGFAGNSAPDHIDQLHAMPELLERTLRAPAQAARAPSAGRVGKPVHHYVFFGQDRDQIPVASSFFDAKRLEGAQVAYTWRQLEPAKDAYDFRIIREDLALLKAKGKKLFIQLQDVTFSEARTGVPDYLRQDPVYHGGADKQYDFKDGDENEENPVVAGWAARRWDPAVQDRFHKLLSALGKEFDGQIEGINFAESSVGFGSTGRYFPEGFSFERYRDALIENMRALKLAFPKSVTLQYGNFMPGEWRPISDKGYLRAVYMAAKELKVGVGGPDLLPFRPGQQKGPYPLIREVAEFVPVGIAVQDGNYGDVNPKTGRAASIAELIQFATEDLKVDYIFWSTEEPYYKRDVIPYFTRRSYR